MLRRVLYSLVGLALLAVPSTVALGQPPISEPPRVVAGDTGDIHVGSTGH